MKNLKYKLTDETKVVDNVTLHRIECVTAFYNVEAGEKGGWIESYNNLSQEDNAWVYGNAKVYGNASVFDNAGIYENAEVCDNATVFGNAIVYDNAIVCENATVCENAAVYENATVGGNAWVGGDATIENNAEVLRKRMGRRKRHGFAGKKITSFFKNLVVVWGGTSRGRARIINGKQAVFLAQAKN